MTRPHPAPSTTAPSCGGPTARPIPAWRTLQIIGADAVRGDPPTPPATSSAAGTDKPPAADAPGDPPPGPGRGVQPRRHPASVDLLNTAGRARTRPTRRPRADLAACPATDRHIWPARTGTDPAVIDGYRGRPVAGTARNRLTKPTIVALRVVPAHSRDCPRRAGSAARCGRANHLQHAARHR